MPVTINYNPHPAQRHIHHARDTRFRCVCTGRRFGKTLCLAAEVADRGAHEGGGEFGWVAPTYNVAERGVEAFRAVCWDVVAVSGRTPCKVEIPGFNGGPVSRVWFLSADNPDSIRGFGFRGLDPGETDYASFRFPSNASPYFPAKEWAEALRTLPEDVFKQEYMAEFMEDSAGGAGCDGGWGSDL